MTDHRVTGWFARHGAADEPAHLLSRLVTNAVPRPVRATLPPLPGPDGGDRTWRRDRDLAARHLPQGAPTSPALADRICRVLDLRLSALAARRGLTYTRYVDDLTFSGDGAAGTDSLVSVVGTIVRDEGSGSRRPRRACNGRPDGSGCSAPSSTPAPRCHDPIATR